MRYLSLYAADPVAAAERGPRRSLDPGCQLCDMHEGVRSVCLSGEGEPGGLLVINESPGRDEDAIGRPCVGATGRELRRLVAAHWTGPVAIDNAIRCSPGRRELKERHIDACRGYLAGTIVEARPTRVITLGTQAARAVTGRSITPFTARRAYSYLFAQADESIPVFHVLHPASAMRNRFVRAWLYDDMKWALTCAPPAPAPILAAVRVVETMADAAAAVAELRAAEWAAFDVETCGTMYEPSFRLLSLSACARGSSAAWAWDGSALADLAVKRLLVAWLEDPTVKKIGQNVKFDVNAVLLTLGARVRGVVGDTRLWRKLLEPEAEGNLAKMSELVGMGGTKEEAREAMDAIVDRVRKALGAERTLERRAAQPTKKYAALPAAAAGAALWFTGLQAADPELVGVIRKDPATWEKWAYGLLDREDRPKLLRYNARDAVSTARLGVLGETELAKVPEVDRIRRMVVDRAAHAVERVEEWGVAVDVTALHLFNQHLTTNLDAVRKRLDACAGADFNPDSPNQVAALLFDKLGLKGDKQTATGKPSTDKAVLEALASKHPVARDLVAHRRFSKLRGTYAEGMLEFVRPDGGGGWRIHPSILLDGARSGRASCQDPNLQNIPRVIDEHGNTEGKMARDVFVASPGCVLVSLDYSQLELRIAAALSQDPEMIAIFTEGVDYHLRTAQLVSKLAWGIPPEKVEKKHRDQAKTINFACIAEGQRVLTDRGLVPIEEVTCCHLVWDGVAWVHHGGLIFKGLREVITYDGLTATPDHEVFTESGRQVPFGVLASAVRAERLAVGADGEDPVRNTALDGKGAKGGRRTVSPTGRDALYGVPKKAVGVHVQLAGGEEQELHLSRVEVWRPAGANTRGEVHRDGAAVRAGYTRVLASVQGPRNQGSVRVAGSVHQVGVGEVAGHRLQGPGSRPAGQQRTLLEVEHQVGDALHEPAKPRVARVYDLLNAGPRHRFTVEGKIVHNCLYGMGDGALAAKIGCSMSQARSTKDAILSTFKQLNAWIADCLAYSQKTGVAWTWWAGERARRRPMWQIGDADDGKRVVAEHGSFNTPVQGTAADYCTASLGSTVEWIETEGLEEVVKLVLPVHDQLLLDVRRDYVSETIAVVRDIMRSWDAWGVPIVVDVETGPSWGSLVRLKEVA